MATTTLRNIWQRVSRAACLAIALGVLSPIVALAHPLGNFTVNHYSRLQVSRDRLTIRYVVDMAEIPAFQTLADIDADNDGRRSDAEMEAYAERAAARYAEGLQLAVNGEPVKLQTVYRSLTTPAGNGGLPTLRLVCDFAAEVGAGVAAKRLVFADTNDGERAGWHEIVIAPESGVAVFDSTAFGNGITDELKAYPDDLLAAPLNERRAEFSLTTGATPANALALQSREGRAMALAKDRFAQLIAVPELTLSVALLGLLVAAGLGAVHALSPGHGKTVVGAYLVGSKGTAKHAAFLGLTVTVTHTLGVLALGLLTLLASKYFLPEKIFPVISLIAGVIVLFLGVSLFFKRLSVALGYAPHGHHHHHHDHAHAHHHHEHPHDHHGQAHSHEHHTHDDGRDLHSPDPHAHAHASHLHTHDRSHRHDHLRSDGLQTLDSGLQTFTHTHGGQTHSHLPPGADGSPVTWKSLLALGVSGGLLPCPSALVVLLSAISLNRVGYGLLLVIAFSVGLAATLTAVGLLFLYAGRLLKRPAGVGRWANALPVLSALFIACVGAAMCYQAALSSGFTQ